MYIIKRILIFILIILWSISCAYVEPLDLGRIFPYGKFLHGIRAEGDSHHISIRDLVASSLEGTRFRSKASVAIRSV